MAETVLKGIPSSLTETDLLGGELLHTRPSEWLERIKSAPLGQVWETLLNVQSRFILNEDLKFFFNDRDWLNAETVLDLGCGPGDLIALLNNYFPKKIYTGVDLSDRYVRTATLRFSDDKNISVLLKDIHEYSPERKFDYIILRLVIQHLPDPGNILMRLGTLLSPNGRILIMDSIDSLKLTIPSVPTLVDMYRQLQALQHGSLGSRNALLDIEANPGKHGFEVVISDKGASPAIRIEDQKLLMEQYLLASEVVKRRFGVVIDQTKLLHDLFAWVNHPYSYAQVALARLLIKKKDFTPTPRMV